MKKLWLLAIPVVLVVGSLLYKALTHMDNGTKQTEPAVERPTEEVHTTDVKEAAWRQLPAGQRERINDTWQAGKVTKVILHEGGIIARDNHIVKIENTPYVGQEVYMIDFPTKSLAIPNNMIVFADVKTSHLIGYGLVD